MRREFVPIDLLLLSDENPRLQPSYGEYEAIGNMIQDQRDKLFELASDIVEHGLNPLEMIGVYPSEKYDGFYEVGEGNRRICALKLLINPAQIQELNENLFVKFKTLSGTYDVPESIEVGIFENEIDMRHWMKIRHMGEQGGKGLSKWDSVQKSRFNRMQTGKDALLDFWDWMTENNVLSQEEIHRVTKTNWQRILREKYFPFLKIQYNGNYKVQPEDFVVFTERIKAVQQKLSGQTVAIVYDQTKIEEFFDSISNMLYGIPYQEVVKKESEQVNFFVGKDTDNKQDDVRTSGDNPALQNDFSSNEPVNVDKESNGTLTNINNSQAIGRDVFNGCTTIIPYGYPIRTENMRLNKIINELKRIDADNFPNACGTLLRTLFELSAKVYLEKQNGGDYTRVEFASAISQAANGLRQERRINNSQHSAICSDIDNLRKIFNGYMHNTEIYPSSEALRNFFKSHKAFIEECLK